MRVANWEQILFKEVDKHHVFEWGKKDCALFVADIVEKMTGIDYAEPFRGKYSTEKGAYMALKKYGHGSLEKWVDSNFKEVKPTKAKRGDVVVHSCSINQGKALGVCTGQMFASQGKDGTQFFPMIKALRAWEVN
jgi:hypothetical protein